jgi:hypothetical protein
MTHGVTTREPPAKTSATDRLGGDILRLAAVVILGTIMTVLDLTIVNVAIPVIGTAFRVQVDTIQWVMTGYMLAYATVIPVTGWAAERFGAKRVWLGALLLFLAGSVLASAAWSAGSLIGSRVIQGLGAGVILPVGQTILAQYALLDAGYRPSELEITGLDLEQAFLAITGAGDDAPSPATGGPDERRAGADPA